ncbi:hypothetical protein [Rothia aerolata]|uniref:PKD domain-containing protein n=1 Tax=Rothia aerolata TaxID=1812262 RepID=A0A917MUZ8_9MICC|nr:hypothetical protein [Rothia aerolata]GGH65761.1 hypothetical protein GCM10007359_19330 [Rothia aerolata]
MSGEAPPTFKASHEKIPSSNNLESSSFSSVGPSLILNRPQNGATALTPRTTTNGHKGTPDITRGTTALDGASCVTLNGTGKAGRLTRIPLPISGDTTGTDSYNTDDAGNYACITDNTPTSEQATTNNGEKINNQQPPQEITLTQQDLQNLPLPAAQLHQDQAPHTLKNYNTNIYAQATTGTFTETIAGQTVEIKATPISYTFTYGDGTTLGPVTNPGHSVGTTWDVKTPTSHQYTQTGTYHYTVTTDYRGEYRVAGERGWRVIPGSASVTSPTQSLQVWRVESGRVAEDCRADGQAWGCGPAGE